MRPCEDREVTSRLGPLTSLTDALAVGDPHARHLRLTPAGIAFFRGDDEQETFEWSEIAEIRVSAPFTLWPHPRLGDTLGAILLGYPDIEPFPVMLTLSDGSDVDDEIDGHHLRGYRRSHTRTLTRLLEHLMGSPASRSLLARPSEVLTRLAARSGSDWGW